MDDTKKKGWIVAAIIVCVILIDQVLKIWVKTSFYLGESVDVASWFQLHFIENNGMAFGMELGSKLFLTIFRVIAVGLLIWYIVRTIRYIPDVKMGYLVCLALVTAGAAGNIFDCVFYGVLFDSPVPPETAVMFPDGGGYAPAFYGKVVDMFYFPLFSFYWPQWMPIVGGEYFIFFQPVFNFADASITVGMLLLLMFYSRNLVMPRPSQPDANQ